jgi:hypothetical protein
MTTPAKAEDLIALTERLAALVEHDVTVLKRQRPAELTANENERAALTLLYAKAMAECKSKPFVAALPASVRKRLKLATERLRKALKEQSRLLARFRHVTEGLVKAIAETVAARETPGVYGKAGQVVKPPASPRAAALTFNKAV